MSMLISRVSIIGILEKFAATYPAQILVLDSAKRSARKCGFRYPEKLAELLAELIPYRAHLMMGGDWEARRFFGQSYAPHESHTTRNNKIARNARTFSYEGRSIYMDQHLKIGVKDSEAETIRVYFAWCPVSQKIIIGHCGVHLPLR